VADGEVAVETHRRQDERGTGERNDLTVQQYFAEDCAQHPCLIERHEQHLHTMIHIMTRKVSKVMPVAAELLGQRDQLNPQC